MEELEKRLAPPVIDDCSFTKLEIEFGIRVYMSQDQQRRLLDLMDEIIKSPANQPIDGVHWLSTIGTKPNFSRFDAAFLGVEPGENPPPDGEEPTFDNDVFYAASSARGFINDDERCRVQEERSGD
jgi:hypothetical protein